VEFAVYGRYAFFPVAVGVVTEVLEVFGSVCCAAVIAVFGNDAAGEAGFVVGVFINGFDVVDVCGDYDFGDSSLTVESVVAVDPSGVACYLVVFVAGVGVGIFDNEYEDVLRHCLPVLPLPVINP